MPIIFNDTTQEAKWRKLKHDKHWAVVLIDRNTGDLYRACTSCPKNGKWHSVRSDYPDPHGSGKLTGISLYGGTMWKTERYVPAEIVRKGKLYMVIGWNSDTLEWRGVEIEKTKYPIPAQ